MQSKPDVPYSVYIHIPFCVQRCPYCDFNAYAGLDALFDAYVRALIAEIRWVAVHAPARLRVHTVYFGGGTPSLLPPRAYEALLLALRDAFALAEDVEITLEANPGTLDLARLRTLRALGFNRLSLGMQAVHPDDLRLLGRIHTFPDVIRAVAWARRAGWANVNLDLMYGLPGQPMSRWQATLQWALRLAPEHISAYALTLEHGTPMAAWVARGLVPPIDDDLAADMYEWTMDALAEAGFVQYEISNWARRSTQGQLWASRHNLQYWRSDPYLGLGAGAHGWVAGYRTVNVRSPHAYIARWQQPPSEPPRPFPWTPSLVHMHRPSPTEALGEYMMMRLRLTQEGVSWAEVRRRFGIEPERAFADALTRLHGWGLIEPIPGGIRLSRRGRLLANWVFEAFLPE
ncbi:MAG: radical SAM family heme chaperone HemW [Chloroflexi bacterium]|nr:radical SAM family heme chaperone HemW [Chloroflexota bacterium]